MSAWICNSLPAEAYARARQDADAILLKSSLGRPHDADFANLRFVQEACELAVDELLGDEAKQSELREVAAEAFRLLRAIPRPQVPIPAGNFLFRLACLGQLGDMGADAARLLREQPWPAMPVQSVDWSERTFAVVLDSWLCLFRKNGWEDLERVQHGIARLRSEQREYEKTHLEQAKEPADAAWRLVSLYHFSKAAEILAVYVTQGQVHGDFLVKNLLDAQFDRAIAAAERGRYVELESLLRLGASAAHQMADNSIWSVTRAVNSRVTKFVNELVHRANQSVFEVLPPQRRTLAEEGLLGSSRRSVVVSLPTSSGKTLIAEFRILQALNQFDQEHGWVAYLAPTRALVSQVTRRLRRDFRPLDVVVEMATPALEIDGLESAMLLEKDAKQQFRVLVTTPEKLDLLLRGGWEAQIGRPLTLVVVDEAHNIGETSRGLRLELLLATINRECKYAQFLLLTPFIRNAREIASWLDERNHQDISLALDWQPNDRAIGIVQPKQEGSGRRATTYTLDFQTRHTSRKTLELGETLPLPQPAGLLVEWKEASKRQNKLAAVIAQALRARGGVIVLAAKLDYCWTIADLLKTPSSRVTPSPDVVMVQKFLADEFADDFPLIDLLNYGVAVHHRGLSDEALRLIEWLFEKEDIRILVATTTVAQGMNFPVAGVVMASHQYLGSGYAVDMPPEDFWNVAGRAGRVDQGSVGIVAFAATSDAKAAKLRKFIDAEVGALNSTLVALVKEALEKWQTLDLHTLVYKEPKWSSLLQYLAHSYRQMENGQEFASRIEQILRATLGFNTLRQHHRGWADKLITGVRAYAERLAGGPLALVDQTGFSLESVLLAMGGLREFELSPEVWNGTQLFTRTSEDLRQMMGVLLRVPELREGFSKLLKGELRDGNTLSSFIADWVNGASMAKMSEDYFLRGQPSTPETRTKAYQECCRQVYGQLAQTVSWGLSALQTINLAGKASEMSEEQLARMRNIPAWVYYGVNSDGALAMRMVGIPREAATRLARVIGSQGGSLSSLRERLLKESETTWTRALGDSGKNYLAIWRQLEGL
ncbi:MAG: DEAD/DEAH box helicase [Verrucomicrobia bacterium]|nr:DEAD/DEAH box helicase [Verrucomicrobiota bacterium]